MLSRADRLGLILRIADHLLSSPDMPWHRIVFALDSLGLDTAGDTLEQMMGTGTDEQVCELALAFGLDLPPGAAASTSATTTTTRVAAPEPLFIFGSHLSKHKAFVGEVGQELAAFGINLFVAHDTITHDTAWEDEIRKALDRADAGLVFVHDGLKDSPWCDQEIGWLQGRHVPVMALRFDATPYGFFARYQAQPVPWDTDARTIAQMTVDRIAAKPELASAFAASLVASMKVVNTFDATRARWRHLRGLDNLDAKLCSQLLEAAKTNNQIYWATSPWDGEAGETINRLIIAFLRRQPGGATIAPDLDAYEKYLDALDTQGKGLYTLHDNPPPGTVTV